uniref:Branched-chain-amino-acid aminotransferase-like protein 2 n=1 Tax=uncultured Thiotrichaceae bacterium TaxID=298394 RepID=A0A6S6UIU7_9GAMM|nr:MAG: Branched-chain-amino-acid aminotransferase-like protein 2 [uncultured Thiotrichaceae bacterium]
MKSILAMWSGPRNLSTAMMRAWENRSDTQVWDEPLYGAYLRQTGIQHPMGEAIIAQNESDPAIVMQQCATPNADSFSYQKHMTHHVLPDYSLDWLAGIHHCFLLRDPREVLLSYAQKREQPTLDDIGLPQQLRLFREVTDQLGHMPMVIDAKDFLRKPKRYLEVLCEYSGIPFSSAMLSWPAGRRESDGVWAEHWYDSVWKSTGFGAWKAREGELDHKLLDIYREGDEIYQELYQYRLV